jgi:hypothetical protein
MCDERERLIGYIYDECDADERRQIETHLKSCHVCQQEIAGLQNVRQDLLAWAVPDHAPVWRPMPAAVAPPVVWWRQTPGWALAAAAAVVLAAGLAGGAATRWMAPPPAQVAGVTNEELNAVHQKIVSMLREELARVDAKAAEVPVPAASNAEALANDQQLERRMTTRLQESDVQTLQNLMGLNNLLQRYKGDSDLQLQRLGRAIEALQAQIDQKGGGR